MIRKIIVLAGICTAVLLSVSCQPAAQQGAKDTVVKVGRVKISKESLELFRNRLARIYPAPWPQYFPAQRKPETFMAESEAIWQYVKSDSLRNQVKESRDWKWKEMYFKSAFFFDLLGDNLGFTNTELESYYKKHKEEFRTVQADANGQDSSFIPPFDVAKRQVADRVFYDKYKPDSVFLASIEGQEHANDSVMVRNHWIYQVRSNPADFYMRQFYFDKTGQVYENIRQIYENKDFEGYIESPDLDVVRAWVPEGRRGMRNEDLIEWLYKWRSFGQYAEARGMLLNNSEYKEMVNWALRIEHANAFLVNEVIKKMAMPEMTPAMREFVELSVLDQVGSASLVSGQMLQMEVDNLSRALVSVAVDSVIHDIRKSVKVEWMQDEFRDNRGDDPAALFAKADSLREAASFGDSDENSAKAMADAENLFRTVATEFAFLPEGRKAMVELAKLLTDRYVANPQRFLLSQAINSYRRAQMLDTDNENRCNNYFMVGFIYDEHLKHYELAEANYKWILRNTPSCALASDAEFMLLHLGEPMTNIEEIQGRSVRQGRDVEFEDESVDDSGNAAS
jgi:tetratricopeptide (TPR) repeat protein